MTLRVKNMWPRWLLIWSLVLGLLTIGGRVGAEEAKGGGVDSTETTDRSDSTEASAEEESPSSAEEQPATLGEVTVAGRRVKHAGVAVQSVSREAIQDLGATRVVEVLDSLPAVQAGRTARGERIFTIRGFDQRQVLVLIDGLPLLFPYSGRIDLGKVPSELVQRIDVIKGSGSVGYGQGGMGGAVNIVTRKPGSSPHYETTAELRLIEGEKISMSASGVKGPGAWIVAGGLERIGGFRLPSAFKGAKNEEGGERNNSDSFDWHVSGKGKLRLAPHHTLNLNLTHFQGAYGIPSNVYESNPRFWRWSDWRDLNVSLSHKGRYLGFLTIEETVFASFLSNTLDSFDNDGYITQDSPRAFQSTFNDSIFGGRLKMNSTFDLPVIETLHFRGLYTARMDRHAEDWREQPDQDAVSVVRLMAGNELEVVWNRYVSTILGHQTSFDFPLDFPEGSDDGFAWLGGPMVEMRINPHSDVVIEVVAARRGRFPTLSERFSSAFDRRVPNSNLSPETSWNFGLDLSWRIGTVARLRFGGFESEVSGLIDEQPLGDGRTQMRNLGDIRLAGAEFDAELRLDYGFFIAAGYAYLYAKRLDLDSPDDRLEYRPAHKATLFVKNEPLRWLSISSRLEVVGPQDFINTESLRWGELGMYYVLGARVEFRPMPRFSIWLRGDNLLDANYQTRWGFPEAGATGWLGIKVAMD